MMYAVKYKNMVVIGLIPWNAKYILDVFKIRYRVNIDIPLEEPSLESFPLKVNDDITIYPAEEIRNSIQNPLLQGYVGPIWEFLDNKVIAHYDIVDYSLDIAKSNYHSVAAKLRYDREISGIEITINNKIYNIETNREDRFKYINQLMMLADNQSIYWKFSNSDWAILSKVEMQSIVNAIDNHVQSAFEYEFNLINAINSSESFQDLETIEELNKKETPRIRKL